MWPQWLDSLVHFSAIPFRKLAVSLILSLFLISASNRQSTGMTIFFNGNPLIEEAVQEMLPDQRTLVLTL